METAGVCRLIIYAWREPFRWALLVPVKYETYNMYTVVWLQYVYRSRAGFG